MRVKVGSPQCPAGATAAPLTRELQGGSELVAAIAGGAAGAWCVRPLASRSRGGLIAELTAAAGAATGATLVAVPEVSYGSRVLDEVSAAHPSLVRVDSSTDDMERSAAWARMAAGHGLAAGGRAVMFAPAPALRLIVVDEEHDSVYKEDRAPRYDARRVALERARLQGAICVFISSTPSLETGAAARPGGPLRSVTPERARARSERPLVELVEPDPDEGLSPELHARARDTLRAGRSVALLAPVAGYARTLWCAACRRSLRCPRCEAGLSSGRTSRALHCRRCGLSTPPPATCPSCGANDFRHLGRGSERYAEQLAKAFPRVSVVHMDRSAAAAGDRSWQGAGIYVTTRFGTKLELRPEVGLVGVIDGDALTRRPDFRAAEQAHQILVEMAEWAGPGAAGGRLVIQTRDPGHHAIQAVVRGDYDFFLQRELEQRQELAYPPFSELVKVSAAGGSIAPLLDEVAAVARSCGARVLGPIEAPFPAGGRDARSSEVGMQLLLKCPSAQSVAEGLRDILPRVPRGSRLRIDVDPR